MSVIALAMMFSSCAGAKYKMTLPMDNALPDTVSESFHSSLQDATTSRYVATVDLDTLSPDRRLEVLILRSLAGVSTEKQLPEVFDRLWEENEEIRELVHQPGQAQNYIRPLAEVYYMLSAVPGPSWQEETAERLYQEALSDMDPTRLSGYALHFYTLALLKNGKHDAALPFLHRLEHFTSSAVYLKDLTIALAYTMDYKGYHTASQLMALICRTGAKHNLKLPEEELEAATICFKTAGKLDLATEALLPVIQENLGLQRYSFVHLLKEPQDSMPTDWKIKEFAVAVGEVERQAPRKTTKDPLPSDSRSSDKGYKVRVELQVIKAGQKTRYVDPALAEIDKDLREILNFSSFKLVGGKNMCLAIGEKGELTLPRSHLLRVTPRKLTSEFARIEVAVLKGYREIFHTFVESVDGGITTIGGPQAGDSVLLLRITTFVMKTATEKRHPNTVCGSLKKTV